MGTKHSKEGGRDSQVVHPSQQRPVLQTEMQPIILKIVVVGSSGAGKTAIVDRLISHRWCPEEHAPTIGVERCQRILVRNGLVYRVVLFDCSGAERLHSIIPGYYRHANGALVVFDLCDESTVASALSWAEELRKLAPKQIGIVAIGNKSDSATANGKLHEMAEQKLSHLAISGVFSASAKSGANIEEALNRLVDTLAVHYAPQDASGPSIAEDIVVSPRARKPSRWCL